MSDGYLSLAGERGCPRHIFGNFTCVMKFNFAGEGETLQSPDPPDPSPLDPPISQSFSNYYICLFLAQIKAQLRL